MQNSKLAELEHIAFSLGAKRYTVEMQESSLEERSESKKAFEGVKLPFGGKKALSSSGETNMEELSHTSKKVLKTAEFTNGAQPVEPTLKWFKYDDEINNLIKMRLSGNLIDNSMKKYSLSLSGSSSSSIGASTAVKIEAAANKLEAGAGYDIASQVKKESSSKLIFNIEF